MSTWPAVLVPAQRLLRERERLRRSAEVPLIDHRDERSDLLTWFTAESFGGPDRFSREFGFRHLISVHRGLKITEPQRRRFVELYMAALDTAGMPADPEFREAVREHVEFGTRVAMQNSHAASDDELHPLRERGAVLDVGG